MRKIGPMQLALVSGTCFVIPIGRTRARPAPQPLERAAA
jgi:hypothetical protein